MIIAQALQRLGVEFSALPEPYLLALVNGRLMLLLLAPDASKPLQEAFMSKWPVTVLRSVEDAEELVQKGKVGW